jgi:GWxTD domain-containing protein
MRVSGSHIRALLVLPLVFLGISPLCARSQDQPAAPRSLRGWLDPTVKEEYKKWLREDVVYIITDEERADFKKLLDDKQRDDFVVAFWERRNPTPGAPDNKFKEEHYRRIAYANQHFAAGIPGWKTDRGRMYIMFGPPDRVEQHPASTGQFSYEIWRYQLIKGIGEDVHFDFVDTCECGDYHMTVDWSKDAIHKD